MKEKAYFLRLPDKLLRRLSSVCDETCGGFNSDGVEGRTVKLANKQDIDLGG